MVLSKGKKILLITVGVLVLVIGTIFGIQIYQDRMADYRRCAEIFLQVSTFFNDEQSSMLQGEGEYGPTYQKIKHKSSFEKMLVETLSEIMDESSNILSMTQRRDEVLVSATALLEQEGIHSEKIAAVLNGYMDGKKQEAFANDSKNNSAVSNVYRMIEAAQSDYYWTDILSEEEVVSFYQEAVETALEQGDFVTVSHNLNIIIEDGHMEQCFPDSDALVQEIMEQCEVYALVDGTGAYYDGVQNSFSSGSSPLGASGMAAIGSTSHSSSNTYCGDFRYSTSSSSSHVDGLLDQASKDKYNTSSSSRSLYFRDMDVEGSFYGSELIWAANDGAQYILCTSNDETDGSRKVGMDGILMLGPDKLYVWDNYHPTSYGLTINGEESGSSQTSSSADEGALVGSPCCTLEGDFSELLQTAKAKYDEAYAPDAMLRHAQALADQGEYEEALKTLRLYTEDETCQTYILKIAVAQMRDGQADQALETAALLPQYSALRGYDMQKIEQNLVADYKADYKYRDRYYQVFCQFMMQASDPMTGDQIRAALVPGSWEENKDDTLSLQADGTGRRGGYMNTSEITWSISGNQLVLRYQKNGNSSSYTVYSLFEDVYLMKSDSRMILLTKK